MQVRLAGGDREILVLDTSDVAVFLCSCPWCRVIWLLSPDFGGAVVWLFSSIAPHSGVRYWGVRYVVRLHLISRELDTGEPRGVPYLPIRLAMTLSCQALFEYFAMWSPVRISDNGIISLFTPSQRDALKVCFCSIGSFSVCTKF